MDKQFIGRVEVKVTQYGELIKISFGEKDRQLLIDTQRNGWNNLVLKKNKAGDKYYLEVDTFQPRKKEGSQDPINDDLPF